jgi:DNA-binding LytR/AlgR family response regulator
MLLSTGRVEIAGEATLPQQALRELTAASVDVGRSPKGTAASIDVAFVDIQMPAISGLQLAAELPVPPWIVFVTAHDRYALRAFEVHALDYLVKPVTARDLDRALEKVARVLKLPAATAAAEAADRMARIERALRSMDPTTGRIAARVGGKHRILEIAGVTHFRADAKQTLACMAGGETFEIDATLTELEERFGAPFARIHRAILVNLNFVREVDARSAAGACVRLRNDGKTELPVARDRIRQLKERFGIL